MSGPASNDAPDPRATRHWLSQRFSAVALVPLGLWFLYSVLGLPDLGYGSVNAWIAMPPHAAMLGLFAWCALWHSVLGLQVVVEDYVARELQRPVIRALQLLHGIAAIVAAHSIWLIAGGPAA